MTFGGDPADAFTVVAPSLPGFTLSFEPGQPRLGIVEMAELFARLMTEVLGYPRFAAQGGDWGGYVVGRLAHAHSDRLLGAHLNFLPLPLDMPFPAELTDEDRAYHEEIRRPYYAVRDEAWPVPLTRSRTPTAYASFPREIRHPPRSLAEQVFNIERWTEMPRGGHFAHSRLLICSPRTWERSSARSGGGDCPRAPAGTGR